MGKPILWPIKVVDDKLGVFYKLIGLFKFGTAALALNMPSTLLNCLTTIAKPLIRADNTWKTRTNGGFTQENLGSLTISYGSHSLFVDNLCIKKWFVHSYVSLIYQKVCALKVV